MTKSRGIGRGRPRVPVDKQIKFRTVGARLEVGLADQFAAWCEERKTKPNREIKRHILELIGAEEKEHGE